MSTSRLVATNAKEPRFSTYISHYIQWTKPSIPKGVASRQFIRFLRVSAIELIINENNPKREVYIHMAYGDFSFKQAEPVSIKTLDLCCFSSQQHFHHLSRHSYGE